MQRWPRSRRVGIYKSPSKNPFHGIERWHLTCPKRKTSRSEERLADDRVNCLKLFLQVVEACGLATVKGHGLKVNLGDANEVGAVFLVVVVEVGVLQLGKLTLST